MPRSSKMSHSIRFSYQNFVVYLINILLHILYRCSDNVKLAEACSVRNYIVQSESYQLLQHRQYSNYYFDPFILKSISGDVYMYIKC
jgi:hypothetical protein